ncbi:MAG: hypothetical protein ABI541_04115 [Betaproteobacteria bacterium]
MEKMVPRDIGRIQSPLVTQEARILPDQRVDALVVGRRRSEDIERCSERENERPARRDSVGDRHNASAGHQRKLGKPGGDRAPAPEEFHRAGVVEVLTGIGRVENNAASDEKLLGFVHLPREFEPFRGRRLKTPPLELVVREADLETVVSAVAKIRYEQAGKLGMNRHEYEPGAVLPAAVEMLPSGDARQLRDQLGRSLVESVEIQRTPKPSEEGEAQECTPLGARQSEDGREVTKEVGVLGPDVRLDGRAATKKLEPPRVDPMRDLATAAPRGLVDEPLRAVESLPIELRVEMLPEVALDRCQEVNHRRFTS